MTDHILRAGRLGRIAVLVITTIPAFASGQMQFDVDLEKTGNAIVIRQALPGYPGDSVRHGQEGWVRMSYVVTADGRAVDPIILNSSGGIAFEDAARQVLPTWRFEPGDVESPHNTVNIRSEIAGGQDTATSDFIRRTKRILNHLHRGETAAAREQADAALNRGGWNLYESTLLWLMMGRVDGAEDNNAGKLEMYNRALEMGNSTAIPGDDRVGLLEKIFLLQSHFQQYAAALGTRRRLTDMRGNVQALERTANRATEMEQKLADDKVTTAKATLHNPCDCNEGEPLWHYVPLRRMFSFANANGNVERFEARCEGQRIHGTFEPGKTWTLAPEWGFCRVIVFGNDGATFDFLEHPHDVEDSAADRTAVARNHVLDRRSRSQ
jgi:TonB family protein